MKIFLSFLQSEQQYPIPAYSFWQYYIKNGITEAGYTWVEHPEADWALGLVPKSKEEQGKWKQETWDKTITYLKKNPVDLFLSYLYPSQVDVVAVKQIKKMGIPCINFFCDNVREFKTIPFEFSEFDLNWVPEFKALQLYQKVGYPYINLPMPMWIEPSLRVFREENNNQITFIGSKDFQRQLLFEQVVEKHPDLPLVIYGSGWDDNISQQFEPSANYSFNKKLLHQYQFAKENGLKAYLRKFDQRKITSVISPALKSKVQGAISFEIYNKLTAESMITLGVNRYPSYNYPIDQPNSYSRLRDLEAPMLGACYLTEFTANIDNIYDIGNEIETYYNIVDLIEKATALQNDKQKRKRLKINGQKRALNDHSIGQSLKKLFQKLN